MPLPSRRGCRSRAADPAWAVALLCLGSLLAPRAAIADEAPGALEAPPHHHTFLAGDDLRWRSLELVPKGPLAVLGGVARNIGADLLAMPAGLTNASAQDVAGFLAVGGLVGSLMAGPLSADAQLQLEVHRLLGPREQRFQLWTPLGDALIFGTVGVLSVGTFITGWLIGQPELIEVAALMLEAFAVAQFFHLTSKLLLGREGPKDGAGLGVIWGPSRSLALFPAGTPSGHAMTLYALMGVLATWFDSPWLTAGLQVIGLALCTAMVTDDYHFVSDLVWGAAMGWSIGEWVTRHRSSRFSSSSGVPVRLQPVVEPRTGTVAVLLSTSF